MQLSFKLKFQVFLSELQISVVIKHFAFLRISYFFIGPSNLIILKFISIFFKNFAYRKTPVYGTLTSNNKFKTIRKEQSEIRIIGGK
jgi:hypothetical protein